MSSRLLPRPLVALLLLIAIAPLAGGDASGEPPDPAARGLDLFLHAPERAASRANLPLQVEAVGFPTAITARALAGATVEAAWDPESLGGKVAVAPPAVRAQTDAAGRAHLDVPVPAGDEGDLALLVGVRAGAHARTRTIKVRRARPDDVRLFVADERVVPGSTVSAWVLVTNASSGAPIARAPVAIALVEGGVPQSEQTITTDASGMAMARVPIPPTDEPTWAWRLTARLARPGDDGSLAARELTPREETPGLPTLVARWSDAEVLPGARAGFRADVRDATGAPVGGALARWWIGPRGTAPPKNEDAWELVSTRAVTSPAGRIEGETTAPSTVVQRVGTELLLVVRARVDGRELTSEARLAVGAPAAEAELAPEAGAIVPGLEQRMLLRVRDGRGDPVSAAFAVAGDGLAARVRTDARGEAELAWRAPADLGARRDVGPCAGGVAAAVTVRVEEQVPALATHPAPFELCVRVDRDAPAIVRPATTIARAGDALGVRVDAARGADANRGWSVVATNDAGTLAASAWLAAGARAATIALPDGASGAWHVTAAQPGRAAVAVGAVLVAPRVLPKLTARVTGGRAAPNGAVDVEATLTDERGGPLPGAVSAVMIDAFGGGSLGGLVALDTRGALCDALGAAGEPRCDAMLEGDPALDAARRALLGELAPQPLAPARDPESTMRDELRAAFASVMHSLEGAVFEATSSADRLGDVRRRGRDRRWQFNPELMTLVTAAMSEPPTTPGGEPIALGDLAAIDAQVSFDAVARRITRLKLFRLLLAVRALKVQRSLHEDEPMFRDPAAIVRRLVRDGTLDGAALLDPWGGSLQFVRTSAPPTPFLTVARGWELRSPGPDGVFGDADDVRDPFERVLRSGTPYADAVEEDRLVDARWDMEVGDATVSAWQSLLEELTGTQLGLGRGEGLGLGEGGGGSGYGAGRGAVRGAHAARATDAMPSGVAFWSPPVRTDARGRVTLRVPLGAIETTWRLALVGVPDGASPATATLDVPSALPIASKVDAGARWIEGDRADVVVTVRSHAPRAVRATLAIDAGGAAELEGARRELTVDVPPDGQSTVRVAVRAPRAGEASLAVTTRAPGLPEDVARHTWQVARAGEPVDIVRARWIDDETDVSAWLDPAPHVALGPARLVLERGVDAPLAGVLDAMDPDQLRGASAMADAVEVAARVGAWAARRGEADVAARAEQLRRRAAGKLAVYGAEWPASWRAEPFAPVTAPTRAVQPRAACPADEHPASPWVALDALDAEPPPVDGSVASCWDALVSRVMDDVDASKSAVYLARALLALAERPHRAARARDTADRLWRAAGLAANARETMGAVALPSELAASRAARAVVYAGLLRAAEMEPARAAQVPRFAAWLAVQRDASGGFGAPSATRAAVRALLAASGAPSRERVVARVVVDGAPRDMEIPARGVAALALPEDARRVVVAPRGGRALVARVERPGLRPWTRPPSDDVMGPARALVAWPAARAGRTGLLRVVPRVTGGLTLVDVRVPLPPGVTLAEPLDGVHQVRGVLVVRRAVGEEPTPIEIPLRFALSGTFTVPEATVRPASDAGARTVVPAQRLVVAPP